MRHAMMVGVRDGDAGAVATCASSDPLTPIPGSTHGYGRRKQIRDSRRAEELAVSRGRVDLKKCVLAARFADWHQQSFASPVHTLPSRISDFISSGARQKK